MMAWWRHDNKQEAEEDDEYHSTIAFPYQLVAIAENTTGNNNEKYVTFDI